MPHLHTLTRWATIASFTMAGLAQAATLSAHETVVLKPSLQVTLDSTAAGLAFSNGTANPFLPAPSGAQAPSGLVNAFNLSMAKASPTGPSTLTSTETVLGSPPAPVRSTLAWLPSVRSVEVDATTGNLLSAQLDGGFRLEAPAIRNVQQGGILAANNLRIDFVRSNVYADLVVSEGTELEEKTVQTHIFSFSRTSGITSLNLDAAQQALTTGETWRLSDQGWSVSPQDSAPFDALAMTGWLELGEAGITAEFLGLIMDGFNIYARSPTFAQIMALGSQEGGTLRMGMSVRLAASGAGSPSLSVAPALLDTTQMQRPVPARLAVPEPGSAVLFSLGLMGLTVTAWRRQPTRAFTCGRLAQCA